MAMMVEGGNYLGKKGRAEHDESEGRCEYDIVAHYIYRISQKGEKSHWRSHFSRKLRPRRRTLIFAKKSPPTLTSKSGHLPLWAI